MKKTLIRDFLFSKPVTARSDLLNYISRKSIISFKRALVFQVFTFQSFIP